MKKLILSLLLIPTLAIASPLAQFCKEGDHPPSWERVALKEGPNYRFHILDLTSQTWRTAAEVDQPKWHHWLTITEPKRVSSDQALLMIYGGNRDDLPPEEPRPDWVELANQTGSLIIELRNVPNQPIRFVDEYDTRYQEKGCEEDALVAFTWDRYFASSDPSWIAQLPMAKSVTRAMDVVQEVAPKLTREGKSVEGFVLSGRSKRGWTAWAAASVDGRVIGVAPMVIDLLNLKHSLTHHYKAYGVWSFALHDYIDRKIPAHWESDKFDQLLHIIEPYSYRDQVAIPKLIINSTGDEFFLPDSSHFYFGALEGEKYLRYIPNVSHDLRNSDADISLSLFYKALLKGESLPKFSWKRQGDQLVVTCKDRPLEVKVWRAYNPKARDFRLSSIGPVWEECLLCGERSFQVPLQAPKEGWAAFVIELKFDSGEKTPYIFTTDVFVLPETLPFQLVINE